MTPTNFSFTILNNTISTKTSINIPETCGNFKFEIKILHGESIVIQRDITTLQQFQDEILTPIQSELEDIISELDSDTNDYMEIDSDTNDYMEIDSDMNDYMKIDSDTNDYMEIDQHNFDLIEKINQKRSYNEAFENNIDDSQITKYQRYDCKYY